MLHLGKNILGLRNHKVPYARQFYTMQRRNLIHIHESAVENSNHHSPAQMSGSMHALAVERLDLRIGSTIFAYSTSPIVQVLAHTASDALTDRIGSRENLHLPGDEIEFIQFAEFLLLMNADQQGIVPLTLAHNLDASLAYSLLISRSHRQIGNIDGQILSLSALYGTGREKICRATYREGSVTEVFVSEIKTIHHTLASRIRHHIGFGDAGQPHQLLKIANPVFASKQRESGH